MLTTNRLIFLFILILSVRGAKRYTALIREVKAKSYQEDVLTDIKTSMRKVNRTTAFANVQAKILKPLSYIPTSIELFRINGATRTQLPFNITGDGCALLKKNYLICKDIKEAGLPDCPLLGDVSLTNFYLSSKNIPNLGILGKFLLKGTLMYENKLLFTIEIVVDLLNAKV